MGSVPVKREAASRSIGMLRTAMGAITSWLDDLAIVEVMLNPDGRLWIDRLAGGLSHTGKRLSAQDGERIVRVVAHHVGAEVHPGSPRISAELPVHGERFEGLLPPIVAAPIVAPNDAPGGSPVVSIDTTPVRTPDSTTPAPQ